jgi:hypothetical protein
MTPSRVIVCRGPVCARYGAGEVILALRRDLADRQLADDVTVESSGCRAHCEHPVVATVFPDAQTYLDLSPDAFETILAAVHAPVAAAPRGSPVSLPSSPRPTRPAAPTRVLWRRWR